MIICFENTYNLLIIPEMTHSYLMPSRLMIVSREAKKKQAVRDE